MSRKSEKKRRYLESKGFINPKPTSLTRSEDGTRYEYDLRIANMFTKWSSEKRDSGQAPTFGDFYNDLNNDDKHRIIVTEVFKSS